MNTKMVDKLYDYNIEKKLTEYTKEQALKDFELYSERNFQNDFNKHFKISFIEEYDEYFKIKFPNEYEQLNNEIDIISRGMFMNSQRKIPKKIYEEEKGLYKEIFKEKYSKKYRKNYMKRFKEILEKNDLSTTNYENNKLGHFIIKSLLLFLNKLKIKKLLIEDKKRADIQEYHEKMLTDIEQGHWSLWQEESDFKNPMSFTLNEKLVAK